MLLVRLHLAAIVLAFPLASWGGTLPAQCEKTPGHSIPFHGYEYVYALVIGVDDYRDRPLVNAELDARRFCGLFPASRKVKVRLLLGKRATAESILQELDAALTWIKRIRSKKRFTKILFTFYFAGHGDLGPHTAYIEPYRAPGVSLQNGTISRNMIRDWVQHIKAVAPHQYWIFGACNVGGIIERGGETATESTIREIFYSTRNKFSAWALVSGAADEKAADGRPGQGSPFGNALVSAFRRKGGFHLSDGNRDHCVTLGELRNHMRNNASTVTPRSVPHDAPLGRGGPYILFCSRDPVRPRPNQGDQSYRRGSASDESGTQAQTAWVEIQMTSTVDVAALEGGHLLAHGTIDGYRYRIRNTEVTRREWVDVMGTLPDESPFGACGSQCPIENVSWEDAVSFLNKKSREEGLSPCYSRSRLKWRALPPRSCDGFRLPTYVEWIYLTRGSEWQLRHKVEWTRERGPVRYRPAAICPLDRSPVEGDFSTEELKTYERTCGIREVGEMESAPGVFDLHGNVSEWLHDELPSDLALVVGDSWRTKKAGAVRPVQIERRARHSDIGFRYVQSR